jgi:hypothetical protein
MKPAEGFGLVRAEVQLSPADADVPATLALPVPPPLDATCHAKNPFWLSHAPVIPCPRNGARRLSRPICIRRNSLPRSHFIIVTHSKRTMSVCDVLYGITVQESGISKRVAVDFKDFPDDGAPTNGQAAPAEEEKPLGSFGAR